MDTDTMESVRTLVDFASTHMHEVFGDESDDARENIALMQLDIDRVLQYLNGDEDKGLERCEKCANWPYSTALDCAYCIANGNR